MTSRNRYPSPPKTLSPAAKRLWRSLTSEFVIGDAAGRAILMAGLESYDRAQAAKVLLDRDGAVFNDRYGQPRAHPAAAVERDSRAAWMSALKQLNLAHRVIEWVNCDDIRSPSACR